MKRKLLGLLLVMAMGMMLLIGCGNSGDKDVNNEKESSVNQEENKDDENTDTATAMITDVWTGKKIEISYNKENCERLSDDEYLLSVSVDSGEAFDIEFHADYTASNFYSEEVQAIAGIGLTASDLSDYSNAEIKVYGYEVYDASSDSLYSCTLLNEVEGGVLIVHILDLGITNEENAKAYVEKVFVSAKMVTDDTANSETDTDSGESADNKLALTNEDKEAVYKADYEAIKDKIVKEEKDGSEASYYDANGLEIMYIYYDGENITDVFFTEYSDNGVRKYRKVYTFDENGEYGTMEFEYHENGEVKTETAYNDDGSKIVFSFDEAGDFISGTEYDKDGNVIE